MTEQWRTIPGLPEYEASTDGQIRNHKGKGGSARILRPHIDRHNGKVVKYRITIPVNGTSRTYQVARLIFTTWLGEIPAGKIVCCRDGDMTNTKIDNLILGDKSERFRQKAKKIGGPNRRPVLKMDTSLEVVDAYRSSREAARVNGFPKETIQDHCNLAIKSSVIAPDGFIYAWDDAKWLRRLLKRAMPELDEKGIRYTDPYTEEYWNLPIDAEPESGCTTLPWADALPIVGGGIRTAYENRSVSQ